MSPEEIRRLMDRVEHLESLPPKLSALEQLEPLKDTFEQAKAAHEPLEVQNKEISQEAKTPDKDETLRDTFERAKAAQEPLATKPPELTAEQAKDLELYTQRQPEADQSIENLRPEFFAAKMAEAPLEIRSKPDQPEKTGVITPEYNMAVQGISKTPVETEGRNSSMVEKEKPDLVHKPTGDFTREQDRKEHLQNLSQERIEVGKFEAVKALEAEEKAKSEKESKEAELAELEDMAASIDSMRTAQNHSIQRGLGMGH